MMTLPLMVFRAVTLPPKLLLFLNTFMKKSLLFKVHGIKRWFINSIWYILGITLFKIWHFKRRWIFGYTLLQCVVGFSIGHFSITAHIFWFIRFINAESYHVIPWIWEIQLALIFIYPQECFWTQETSRKIHYCFWSLTSSQ